MARSEGGDTKPGAKKKAAPVVGKPKAAAAKVETKPEAKAAPAAAVKKPLAKRPDTVPPPAAAKPAAVAAKPAAVAAKPAAVATKPAASAPVVNHIPEGMPPPGPRPSGPPKRRFAGMGASDDHGPSSNVVPARRLTPEAKAAINDMVKKGMTLEAALARAASWETFVPPPPPAEPEVVKPGVRPGEPVVKRAAGADDDDEEEEAEDGEAPEVAADGDDDEVKAAVPKPGKKRGPAPKLGRGPGRPKKRPNEEDAPRTIDDDEEISGIGGGDDEDLSGIGGGDD